MIATVVVLLALPIGLLVRRRLVACLVYGFLAAHVFTVQTAVLVMQWTNGAGDAFAQDPGTDLFGVVAPYLVVTLVVNSVGFGVVLGAGTLAGRRRAGRRSPEPATQAVGAGK